MASEEISAIVKAVDTLDEIYKVGHEVAELIPNKHRKDEIFVVGGGSKSDIALQQSLFMTQYQLLNNTFGIDPPNFKDWIDQFEKCFPNIIKNNKNIDNNGTQPWGTDINNRPRIRVVNVPAQQKEVPTTVYIEFQPERNNENEVYFLAGTITQVVGMIWHIWNTRQIMKQQNFQQVVGYPIDQYMTVKPHQGITLHIYCTTQKTPPFYKSSLRPDYQEVRIAIPFADKSKLTYENIRNAVGGNNGIAWGYSKAVAHVADGLSFYSGTRGMPQVWTRGDTYENAKKTLKAVMALSKAVIAKISEGKEDKDEYLNPLAAYKPPSKIYPGWFFITNGNLVGNNTTPGKQLSLGKYATKKNKFLLWPTAAPADFNDRLNELFEYDNQS